MRLLLQRVSRAKVTIQGNTAGEIGPGLVALVGLGKEDNPDQFDAAIDKMINLRIFSDGAGNMNRSVLDVNGGILAISQFTLYADARKGRRPSFINAMPPVEASALFDQFLDRLREKFDGPVETGQFGAMMDVELVNDGPVTIWLDSEELGWSGR